MSSTSLPQGCVWSLNLSTGYVSTINGYLNTQIYILYIIYILEFLTNEAASISDVMKKCIQIIHVTLGFYC